MFGGRQKMRFRSLVEYENPNSLGAKLRRRRLHLVETLILHHANSTARVRILDIGGRRHYWDLFGPGYLHARKVHVTIVNLPSETILDTSCDQITITTGNGCDLQEYSDHSFDIVHSNSTVEHVGCWKNMQRFASEVRRLAPSFYVQTPYFYFPIEPHYLMPFVHWVREDWRARLLTKMSLGNYPRAETLEEAYKAVRDADLLDRTQLKRLFPDATIHYEYLGPLPPKSLIAVRMGGSASG